MLGGLLLLALIQLPLAWWLRGACSAARTSASSCCAARSRRRTSNGGGSRATSTTASCRTSPRSRSRCPRQRERRAAALRRRAPRGGGRDAARDRRSCGRCSSTSTRPSCTAPASRRRSRDLLARPRAARAETALEVDPDCRSRPRDGGALLPRRPGGDPQRRSSTPGAKHVRVAVRAERRTRAARGRRRRPRVRPGDRRRRRATSACALSKSSCARRAAGCEVDSAPGRGHARLRSRCRRVIRVLLVEDHGRRPRGARAAARERRGRRGRRRRGRRRRGDPARRRDQARRRADGPLDAERRRRRGDARDRRGDARRAGRRPHVVRPTATDPGRARRRRASATCSRTPSRRS